MWPWPYPNLSGYFPPLFNMPGADGWTSSLDSRTNMRSRYGKQTYLGSGCNHHDIISFSLTNAKEPSDETLIVMNPVKESHFKGLQTSRLEALFEELSDLQEAQLRNPCQMFEECEMRQLTLETLEEELQRRKQWSESDDGEDLDGDKEDE